MSAQQCSGHAVDLTVYGVGNRQCREMESWMQKIGTPASYGLVEAYVDGYLSAKRIDIGELQPRMAMRKVLDLCEVLPNITFFQAVEIFAAHVQPTK